jgi:hypothetical protein
MACGGPDTTDYDCKTACGTRVKDGNCDALSLYEEFVFQVYSLNVGWNVEAMCRVMGEYWVQVVSVDHPTLDTRGAVGFVDYDNRAITLAVSDEWAQGSYAHEALHAFRQALDRVTENNSHPYWISRGFYSAVAKAKMY